MDIEMGEARRRTQVERRDEAERRMLEAAVRIVAVQGLDGLRLADVGIEAGYSRGLPAHHFGTKAAFEEILLRFISSEFLRQMAELTRPEGLTGLIELIRGYCDLSKDPLCSCVTNIVLSDRARGPNVSEDIAKLRQSSFDEMERHINQGIKMGEIRDDVNPERLTFVLVAAINGLLQEWLTDHSIYIQAASEELIGLIESGLRPRR
jgi:AcrR family transcriptional regulator